MVFNGNGILEVAEVAQALDISSGECDDTPTYTALNCTCITGLTTYASCTSPYQFCKWVVCLADACTPKHMEVVTHCHQCAHVTLAA